MSYRPEDLPRNLINKDKPLRDLVNEPIDKNKIEIHINKSAYKLAVFYDGENTKEYAIVLGPDPVHDKLREGDGRTPEGEFRVQDLYPHPSWSKFIWINYPTKDSWKKHEQAKAKGLIGANDGIGGEIGIHGVPSRDDRLITEGINWTHGCISLTRRDINEIYEVLQVGTKVRIIH
jgi:murein L,D-transpeptidase YafK